MGEFLRHALGASLRVLSANSVADWLTAGAVAFVTWSTLLLARRVAHSRLGRPAAAGRPFVVGDVLTIDTLTGTVERVAYDTPAETLREIPALLDLQHRVNLAIVELFQQRGIRFAVPMRRIVPGG